MEFYVFGTNVLISGIVFNMITERKLDIQLLNRNIGISSVIDMA